MVAKPEAHGLRLFVVSRVVTPGRLAAILREMDSHANAAGSEGEEARVQAAQAGDHAAFEALLDAHLGHLRTFLALKAPVPGLVDELAHDTFVFAHSRLGDFQPGTSFRAWLRAIAWNLLRAEVQRHARERRQLDRLAESRLAEWDMAASESPPPDGVEHLGACLGELAEPLRELVLLKYRDEETTKTIATRLSRSLVWVRVALFRARRQLRTCVEAKLAGRGPC